MASKAKPRTPPVKNPIQFPNSPLVEVAAATEDCHSPTVSEKGGNNNVTLKLQIDSYLRAASGQLVPEKAFIIDHDYCKPFHTHPDPTIQAHAAKFLFMKNFPTHIKNSRNSPPNDDLIDVVSYEEPKKIPFLTPKSSQSTVLIDEDIPEIEASITNAWTCEMNRLWTRATKIINSDRVACLSFKRHANEALLIRNLQEQTANKFRELFASTFWDMKLVAWLHNTLLEHLNENYKTIYVDSLKILKHKIPNLIDTFYSSKVENKAKPYLNDPLFNTLSHYKLSKLVKKPIFIIVPNGPNQIIQNIPRLKYWHSLFNQMGKVITIPIVAKPTDFIVDILSEIRCAVNEKIHHCKSSFTNRPVVLVGFHHGSLIAAHCALQSTKLVSAIICLGFPLKGLNGVRGELDDPLLELTTPIQFIIGENSMMTSLDDIEDFRERMTKSVTSLVMVGGADDRLVVSNTKKRLECLTQSMVDRCVANEIYSFLSMLLPQSSEYRDIRHSADSHLSSSVKRKPNRKRPNPNDEFDPSSGLPKPKRKRPPSKVSKLLNSKSVAPISTTDLLTPPSAASTVTPMLTPIIPSFPNLASALSSSDKTVDIDFIKSSIGSIKVDKSKLVISDKTITFPSGSPTKKPFKKSLGANAINISLNSSLSPIKEDSLNTGLIPLVDASLTAASVDPVKTEQASGVATPSTPITSSTGEKIHSPSKDSYSISETATIHQSATRHGRPIKPPKSLDI